MAYIQSATPATYAWCLVLMGVTSYIALAFYLTMKEVEKIVYFRFCAATNAADYVQLYYKQLLVGYE